MADCSRIAGRVWPGHCCAHGSEGAAASCTIDSMARGLGEACVRFAVNRRLVCVYRSEKRWEGVQWDARSRPALGEGEDPVNIKDANIGLESACKFAWRIEVLIMRPSRDGASAGSFPIS